MLIIVPHGKLLRGYTRRWCRQSDNSGQDPFAVGRHYQLRANVNKYIIWEDSTPTRGERESEYNPAISIIPSKELVTKHYHYHFRLTNAFCLSQKLFPMWLSYSIVFAANTGVQCVGACLPRSLSKINESEFVNQHSTSLSLSPQQYSACVSKLIKCRVANMSCRQLEINCHKISIPVIIYGDLLKFDFGSDCPRLCLFVWLQFVIAGNV